MSLIDTLTAFCENQYHSYGECKPCSHPSGKCSGGCRNCSEEVNYHRGNGRSDYNCQKFIYYYVCRYSWKYCSEMIYALESIDCRKYPEFHILSIGCGGAPDLTALGHIIKPGIPISYQGYDKNPYWQPVHTAIQQYMHSRGYCNITFQNRDIFEAFQERSQPVSYDNYNPVVYRCYNMVVLEYLISHFPTEKRDIMTEKLFDGLIQCILPHRVNYSPFLIIINDIDHEDVIKYFDRLIQKLLNSGYHFTVLKRFFKREKETNRKNRFEIPSNIKQIFNCAIKCTSAQMIVEVR